MIVFPKAIGETTKLHAVYDAWNRLVTIKSDNGGQPGTSLRQLEYDGLNRRIVSGVSAIKYHSYYNTSWQLIELTRSDKTHPHWQYVWDLRYIDAPVLWWRDQDYDGTPDQVQYYTNDANMNVTALVNQSDGSVYERYEYDPYGKLTVLDADWSTDADNIPDNWNHYTFQGTYWQSHTTNLYTVRNRIYHPTLGRWLQRDPIGYADGQNLQAAYHVMHGGVDPMGLARCSPRDTTEVVFRTKCGFLKVKERHEVHCYVCMPCTKAVPRPHYKQMKVIIGKRDEPKPDCWPAPLSTNPDCVAYFKTGSRVDCNDCCLEVATSHGMLDHEFLKACLTNCP